MRVLLTGGEGFIARNLRVALSTRPGVEVLTLSRRDTVEALSALVNAADFVFHLAGVNRPTRPEEFELGNAQLGRELARACADRQAPVVYASSIQAAQDNPYGRSKRAAEEALEAAAARAGFPLHIFRLPNVFGKWSRPDYNSVVATFCHRIARDLPIEVHDPSAVIRLVYVDDVVSAFTSLLDGNGPRAMGSAFEQVQPEYSLTVGELAQTLRGFRESRSSLVLGPVGSGLTRALYATYVSFLPPSGFSYPLTSHSDPRGTFVEVLKTCDSGQFSYFTAKPGVTRGGHYHHTKTEKFLVLSGEARFRFRHMLTGEEHEIITNGGQPCVVETVPGWTHDITNTGNAELVVMLWANEVFDRDRPDTFACKL